MLGGQGQHYRLKTTHRVEQAAEADGCAVLRRQGQRAVCLHGQGSGTAADAHGVDILPRNIFPLRRDDGQDKPCVRVLTLTRHGNFSQHYGNGKIVPSGGVLGRSAQSAACTRLIFAHG